MTYAELVKQMIDTEAAKKRALELVAKSKEGHPALIDAAQAQAARDATFATGYDAPYTATAPGQLVAPVADPRVNAAGVEIAPTNPHAQQFLGTAVAARDRGAAAAAAQAQRYQAWLASQQTSEGARQNQLSTALAGRLAGDAQQRVAVNDVNRRLAANQVQGAELDRLRLVQQQAQGTYRDQYNFDIAQQTEAAQAALAAQAAANRGRGGGSSGPKVWAPPVSSTPRSMLPTTFIVPRFTPPGAKKPTAPRAPGPVVRRS